jgi:putative intracellular protease/amidase
LAAADALLAAVRSPSGKAAVFDVLIVPADHHGAMGDASRYTAEELAVAMDFLIRAGFLDDQD